MDDTEFLECTQALPEDWDDDDDDNGPSVQPELVAWLEVGETKYEIYEGETKIGRDPDSCKIALPQKVLSKQHAVLEVTADVHTLADLGSMNKTRIGKMVLKPEVRYALQGGEALRFGDVKAKYLIKPKAHAEDSGSETGSESMLLDDTEDRGSPVLNHQLPGLDVSYPTPDNNRSNCKSDFDDSDFVPETQESKKDKPACAGSSSSSSHMKTFVPESPSLSQSTPVPKKKKVSFVPDTPSDISYIENENAITDDDSFFESSQPSKTKVAPKRKEEKCIKQKESEYNSDSSTDVEDDDDVATQLFGETSCNGKITKNLNSSKEKNLEDDDDIFNQPTQAFSADDHSINKSKDEEDADNTQDVLDAFGDDNEDCDDDDDDERSLLSKKQDDGNGGIFKMPLAIAPKSKKRVSGSPKGCNNDDLFEDDIYNMPTQPFVADAVGSSASHDKDMFDAPTQAFDGEGVAVQIESKNSKGIKSTSGDDDEDDEDDIDDIFNQNTQAYSGNKDDTDDFDAPTQAFESAMKKPKEMDDDKSDDDLEDIFNQPTQAFVDQADKSDDICNVATQLFDSDVVDSPKRTGKNDGKDSGVISDTGVSLTTPVKDHEMTDDDSTPMQVFKPLKSPADAQKKLAATEDDDDDLPPTQLFSHVAEAESTEEIVDDDDLPPTQLFSLPDSAAKTPKKVIRNDHLPTGDKASRTPKRMIDDDDLPPTQIFSQVANAGGSTEGMVDDDLPPTQLFTNPDSAAKTPKKVISNDNLPPGNEGTRTPKRVIDDDDLPPTQLFHLPDSATKHPKQVAGDDDDDDLPPTQLFTVHEPAKKSPNQVTFDDDDDLPPTQLFTHPEPAKNSPKLVVNDDDDLPPTQLFTHPKPGAKSPKPDLSDDDLPPTQLFTHPKPGAKSPKPDVSDDDLPPTQLYAHPADTSKTGQAVDENDEDLPPTQPFNLEVKGKLKNKAGNDKVKRQSSQKEGAVDDADYEAPTQPFNTMSNTLKDNSSRNSEKIGHATEKIRRGASEVWDAIDADATQEITLDTEIGIDAAHSISSHSNEKQKGINSNQDGVSDVESDTSETLLNEDSMEEEGDAVDDQIQEGTRGESKVDKDEKNKISSEAEDYHSDESTDIEEELPELENKSISVKTVIGSPKLSESELSSTSAKKDQNLRANVSKAEVPIIEGKSESKSVEAEKPKLEFRKVYKQTHVTSQAQRSPVTMPCSSPFTQDAYETQDITMLDIRFGETQDSDDNSHFMNEDFADHFSSSDSESEVGVHERSQKLFDLTPEVEPQTSSRQKNQKKAANDLGCNVKRKLPYDKDDESGESDNFSGFSESPNKKRKNASVQKLEEAAEKQNEAAVIQKLETDGNVSEAGSSGAVESPNKRKKHCNEAKPMKGKEMNIQNKNKENEKSVRQTRKRTQDSVEIPSTSANKSDSKSKEQKLKGGKKTEQVPRPSKVQKLADNDQDVQTANLETEQVASPSKARKSVVNDQDDQITNLKKEQVTRPSRASKSAVNVQDDQTADPKKEQVPRPSRARKSAVNVQDDQTANLKKEQVRRPSRARKSAVNVQDDQTENPKKEQVPSPSRAHTSAVDNQNNLTVIPSENLTNVIVNDTTCKGRSSRQRRKTVITDSECDTSSRESSVSLSKEVTVDDVKGVKRGNLARRYSTSSTQSTQSLLSDCSSSSNQPRSRRSAAAPTIPKDSLPPMKRGKRGKKDASDDEAKLNLPDGNENSVISEQTKITNSRGRRSKLATVDEKQLPSRGRRNRKDDKVDTNAKDELTTEDHGEEETTEIRGRRNELVADEDKKISVEKPTRQGRQKGTVTAEKVVPPTKPVNQGRRGRKKLEINKGEEASTSAVVSQKDGKVVNENEDQVKTSEELRLYSKKDKELENVDKSKRLTCTGKRSPCISETEEVKSSETEKVAGVTQKKTADEKASEDKETANETSSQVRLSRRSRREPKRFSPERNVSKRRGEFDLSQDSEGISSLPTKRGRKSKIPDEEVEILPASMKSTSESDRESQDGESQEFAEPQSRRGRRTLTGRDQDANKPKIIKEKKNTVIQQPEDQQRGRRGRASIATSQPSSQKLVSNKGTRLSAIPEKSLKVETISFKGKIGTEVDNKIQSGGRKPASRRKSKSQGAVKEDSDREAESKQLPVTSGEDSDDSQNSNKSRRQLLFDKMPSTPKSDSSRRSKQGSPYVGDKVIWSPSQRQEQASNRPRVLFTGYKDEQDERIVLDLGGKVVDSPRVCSVLVTTNVRRTCKLLAVIGKGMPIVTPSWLSASKQARNFVDPWKYLVKDIESEAKFGFRLEQSLRSAAKFQLFEGLEIHATKSVRPPPDQMKEIVECSGGQYLDMPPKRYSPQIRIVSCPEDKGLWTTFRRVGIPILGTEFVLTGLLRHELLLDDFELK